MVVRFGIVRLQAHGLAELGDGSVHVAFLRERGAQVIVRFGVVRLQAHGLTELGDGSV